MIVVIPIYYGVFPWYRLGNYYIIWPYSGCDLIAFWFFSYCCHMVVPVCFKRHPFISFWSACILISIYWLILYPWVIFIVTIIITIFHDKLIKYFFFKINLWSLRFYYIYFILYIYFIHSLIIISIFNGSDLKPTNWRVTPFSFIMISIKFILLTLA